nr:hypothetical protein [Cytophagales bacterium]
MLSFWKKNTSAKCPVTPEDKEWIDGNLQWLDRNVVALAEQPTVLPTKEFFSRKFTSTEDDAHYVLERVGEICGINVSMIQLDFFHDQIDFGNGLLTTREKHESGVAGSYLGDDEGEAIMIERDQLKD